MKGSWPWIALFAAALALGLATATSAPTDSPVPSISNPGPQGARVLHTWLTENGARVETIDQPLTAIPPGLQALVIAAPTTRAVTEEEVDALERFVQQGGTLVYLAPRPPSVQPELSKWLKLSAVRVPLPDTAPLGDLGGMSLEVEKPDLLPGVKQLRVSSETVIEVAASDAVAVAGKALWVRPMGKGHVWIGAGADLIENRRLELLDNLRLWSNLRSLRIGFDEFHHVAGETPRWSANLWASFLQVIFLGLLFIAARARRLGPARPTLRREHRSSLEYVQSMGSLMRRAKVDGELKLELRARLRRLMHERLGIALTLGADEASRLVGQQTGIPADAYLQLDGRLIDAAADFPAIAAEAARIEDAITGRQTSKN